MADFESAIGKAKLKGDEMVARFCLLILDSLGAF